jgi:lysophospholipase L1-like esterase
LSPRHTAFWFRGGHGLAWLLLASLLAACGAADPRLPRLGDGDVVVAFGDSLTHGTGAEPGQTYPAYLHAMIGRPVVNAGVPGETTGEGLQRLPAVLAEHQPRLLLLCLGGNDMLRRMDVAQTTENLRAMVRLAQEQGVAVVLIGVPEPKLLAGPPDFYADIADQFGLPYEGEAFNEVLKTRSLKSDPIHANGSGYRKVAERLAELLQDVGAI